MTTPEPARHAALGLGEADYPSQSVEAFYSHVPGLKMVVPSTPRDSTGMLRSAIADPDPVIFLEHKATYRLVKGEVPDEYFTIPLGPADVQREGLSVAVVDVRCLRPPDAATIVQQARRTGKCLVVHEDNRLYGAGAEIAALIAEEAFDDLDAPVLRLGGPESPAMPFNTSQEEQFMPNPERIAAQLRKLARY